MENKEKEQNNNVEEIKNIFLKISGKAKEAEQLLKATNIAYDEQTKALETIISSTIEREYWQLSEKEPYLDKRSNEKLISEGKKLGKEINEIEDKLTKVLPDEYKDMVEELIEACTCYDGQRAMMLFKEGVILGVTDLNYLGKIGRRIQEV